MPYSEILTNNQEAIQLKEPRPSLQQPAPKTAGPPTGKLKTIQEALT